MSGMATIKILILKPAFLYIQPWRKKIEAAKQLHITLALKSSEEVGIK